jgi:hypothetical protein
MSHFDRLAQVCYHHCLRQSGKNNNRLETK